MFLELRYQLMNMITNFLGAFKFSDICYYYIIKFEKTNFFISLKEIRICLIESTDYKYLINNFALHSSQGVTNLSKT